MVPQADKHRRRSGRKAFFDRKFYHERQPADALRDRPRDAQPKTTRIRSAVGAAITPRSQTMAVISGAGVTSNTGLKAS